MFPYCGLDIPGGRAARRGAGLRHHVAAEGRAARRRGPWSFPTTNRGAPPRRRYAATWSRAASSYRASRGSKATDPDRPARAANAERPSRPAPARGAVASGRRVRKHAPRSRWRTRCLRKNHCPSLTALLTLRQATNKVSLLSWYRSVVETRLRFLYTSKPQVVWSECLASRPHLSVIDDDVGAFFI